MPATQDPPLPRSSPPNFTDHHFTTPSGVSLSVRIWPADPPVSYPAPFISWTHGGGYLAGHHFAPLSWLDPGFRCRGYHLVSHNYRLGPQARLDDQVRDSLHAIQWCRVNLPQILGDDKVDVDRYAICGESAGGTLVTLMAHQLSPPPKAVIDAYGPVDFLRLGVMDVQEEGQGLPPWKGEFTEKQLEAFFWDRDPRNGLKDALSWKEHEQLTEEELSARWRTEFTYTERIRFQSELHVYRSLYAGGSGFLAATLHKEKFADSKALREYAVSQSPLLLLEGKDTYPPTAVMHATGDPAVPLSQSLAMAKKLREMGVPVIESYEPDQQHVFDDKYTSTKVPGWDEYIQPIVDFVNFHVMGEQ